MTGKLGGGSSGYHTISWKPTLQTWAAVVLGLARKLILAGQYLSDICTTVTDDECDSISKCLECDQTYEEKGNTEIHTKRNT